MVVLKYVGFLVLQPGIEPASLALEGRCFYHWTTREAPEDADSMHETGCSGLVHWDDPEG